MREKKNFKITWSKGLAPEQVAVFVNGQPFYCGDTMIKQHLFCGYIEEATKQIKRLYRKRLKQVRTRYTVGLDLGSHCQFLGYCHYSLYDLVGMGHTYKEIIEDTEVKTYTVETGTLGEKATKKDVIQSGKPFIAIVQYLGPDADYFRYCRIAK